jgi:hypothetical protein
MIMTLGVIIFNTENNDDIPIQLCNYITRQIIYVGGELGSITLQLQHKRGGTSSHLTLERYSCTV